MSAEVASSRRLFLKTSASVAAGLGIVTIPTLPARGADAPTPDGNQAMYRGKTISEWVRLLKAPEHSTRSTAATQLGKIGSEAKAAVPALTDALKDKHGQVRTAVAEALGKIGAEAKTAVPALTDALKDKDERVRETTALSLGLIGPAAKAAMRRSGRNAERLERQRPPLGRGGDREDRPGSERDGA